MRVNFCLTIAKLLQNESDNIRYLAESFSKDSSGILKISTSSFFAKNILIDLIQKYSNKFTKVRIEVNIEEKCQILEHKKLT
ncbi:hypothetical protein [Francisella persica]|uniref:hypothetical protein n=1 Tax=Francisella persica TaxID=954 RepID=UPI000AC6725F